MRVTLEESFDGVASGADQSGEELEDARGGELEVGAHHAEEVVDVSSEWTLGAEQQAALEHVAKSVPGPDAGCRPERRGKVSLTPDL